MLTRVSSEQVERELIYKILLELKSDLTQIKQFMFSQLVQPKSLPVGNVGNMVASFDPVKEVKPEEELRTLEEVERDLISHTLGKTNWSKRKAAQILGISERTLYRKINEYNLQEKDI